MTTKVKLVAKINADAYKVTISNNSRWATVPDPVKTGLTGSSVFIPVLWNGDADYTFVAASSGTVSADGITVDNLSQDVTVVLTDAKVKLVVNNDDIEAVSSVSPSSSYVPVNTTVTCQITYKSGYDYHYVKSSVGSVTPNGLEVQVGTSDLSVTILPNILDVYVANNNAKWVSTSPTEAHVRYGTPVSFNATYTDGADVSCLVTPVSSDVDGLNGNGVTVSANSFSVPDGVSHGGNIILAPAKVQVRPNIVCTEVVSASPTVQYVTPGSSATFTLTYASGKSASDISVSRGTISGNTLTVSTSSSERYAVSNIRGYVTIDGRKYPTAIIGNKMWMVENLDYRWSGLTIETYYTSDSVPYATYYMGNESTYGYNGKKWGLEYNLRAINYLNTNMESIAPGWRVPVYDDFRNLFVRAGLTTNNFQTVYSGPIWNLHSTDTSLEWAIPEAGSDLLGFNGVPSGYKTATGGTYQWKRYALWADNNTSSSSWGKMAMETWAASEIQLTSNRSYYMLPVRLVKDI